MNKAQLITQIAESADMTKRSAGEFLQELINALTDALRQGDRVFLNRFGTFSVYHSSPRPYLNPSTGKMVMPQAKNVVKFKASIKLNEAIK